MSQTIKCNSCGFDNPQTHSFCGGCGSKLKPEKSRTTTSLINSPIEGERKQVTIIFADISGFTALNDAAKTPSEVEQVVRLINNCLQELSEAIYEFDGRIDKYIGDAIMAVFGAPKAHEDDPERALRAALSMYERMENFNKKNGLLNPLGIHMGINTGTVIAGMVGTDRMRSYTVMGDAVNVASRLEGVSERGELIISEATYNLAGHIFEVEKRDPVMVKGKRNPIKIYKLKGISSNRPKPPEAPLIGREYELKTLLSQCEKLNKRQGHICVVTSDAGLGKSRLISEFNKLVNLVNKEKTDKQKPLWLFGRGLSYRQSFKNRLFVDVLHSYLALPENPEDSLVKLHLEKMCGELFGTRKTEVMPYLATILGISLDDDIANNLPQSEQVLQQRTSLAIGEWVEALSVQQPIVMIFEDLHWADPSSVSLIEYLFTLTHFNRILMVCVTRPDRESHFWKIKPRIQQEYPDHFTELSLSPLTDEESRQLIKHQLKIDQMPTDVENLLLSRSEGNPLFLEEVLRSLIDTGAIKHTDGHWEITRHVTEMDIPHTLQGVLMARIDRLEESVKRVLQIAAVIGRYFSYSVLEPIVNDTETLKEALNQLEAVDLIEIRTNDPEPEYMFKHILTHETAYNSMLHQQRKTIHKQIADYMARLFWVLGEEYAPIVADHYYKSETWPRAMRYLRRAAEAAIQSFANDEAVEFYNRTLEVANIIGTEADQSTIMAVHEGRAKILTRMGEPQKAIADYEAMLAKAKELKNDSAEMRALNGLGSLHSSYYDFSLALEFFKNALAAARRINDEQGKAYTLNQLGNFHYNMGEFKKGISCYQEAKEISTTLKDETLRIEAEDGLAKLMLEQGEIAACLERYQEDIVVVRRRLGYRSGLMNSLSSMLMAQTYIADYKGAAETAAEALELHERSGDMFELLPSIKYYQAFGQIHQGELKTAKENLENGLQVAQEQGQKSSQALGRYWLSYYYLNVGLNEEGLRQAEQGYALAKQLGSPLYVMRAETMLGAAYRHLGQLDKAATKLKKLCSISQNMALALDEVMILYQLSRAYIDLNQWDKASESTQKLLALATASDMKEFIVRGQWVQSLVYIHQKKYNKALNILIDASNLAEKIDSHLSQYLIQIQKSYVYQIGNNSAASRDAMIYAQKLQKRLLDSMQDETMRKAFLNNLHALHLKEIVQQNISAQIKM